MALRSSTVTATESPRRLAAVGDGDYDATRDLMMVNVSAGPVWVGDDVVTPETGIPVPAGTGLSFDAITLHNLPWVVTSVGEAEVRVLELGV